METGIKLIAKERQEQITKHGFNTEWDSAYKCGELVTAAKYCINLKGSNWPEGWDASFRAKIYAKSYKERLVIAGAFIAAELDRLLLVNTDKQ